MSESTVVDSREPMIVGLMRLEAAKRHPIGLSSDDVPTVLAHIDALRSALTARDAALRRFGRHFESCMYVQTGEHGCTCGWDEALEKTNGT